MIRIVHAITDLDPGGAERVVLELVRYRDRGRFAVTVAYLRGGGRLRAVLEGEGARVVRLEPAGPHALRDLLGGEGADLLHTHLIRADFLGGALTRGWRKTPGGGIPWITTKHNTHYFRGVRAPYRLLDRASNLRAARVVAVSQAVRLHFARSERLDPARIEVVRNGITTSSTGADALDGARRARVRSSLGIAPGAPVLIQVGSLTRQKGHAVALRALRILAGGEGGLRPLLLVVGEGPLRGLLAGRARRLGLGAQVRFLGLRGDVPDLLRAADLLVLPSLWEGFGLALLEGMDAGLAVVASRVGGIPEVVRDGETGVLVRPGDARALAREVGNLLGDPERRVRMGRAGRARARGSFRAEAMARAYEGIYSNILAVKE